VKKVPIFLISILCCGSAYTQTKTIPLNAENTFIIDIKPDTGNQVTGKPIYVVEVFDFRDDSSSLGYNYSTAYKKHRRYVFETPVSVKLSNWLGNYLRISENKNAGYKLLVCLKKLRISEEVAVAGFKDGHQANSIDDWESGVILKTEFFLHDGNFYYPMYKFDSIITISSKLPEHAAEYLNEAFKASLSKLYKINMDLVLSKARKMALDDIFNYSKKYEKAPILSSAIYKKGAYANFEEFKLNTPSILDIEYKKGKMGDMLYVKKDGLEYPDRTVWGFSDGKSLFINSCDKFSELIQEGNTYYFKGIKGITRKAQHKVLQSSVFNFATNTGPKKTVYDIEFRYYQVDMETGEVY